ncbi:MAG: endolytic transglycosylase MltG [Bdellovibrionales bacterium]|nr:endolytic transglycosylase MltG [Bdellovibrionales bacterium]
MGTYKLPNRTNMFEVAEQLENQQLFSKDEFLSAATNRNFAFSLLRDNVESLEGYLYPKTYTITEDMSVKDLVRIMVNNFSRVYEGLSRSRSYFSRHEVVTLASMVEQESLKDWEKPRIASVFHNRLQIGMRLQSDPTVYYGILRQTGVKPSRLYKSDFKEYTSYNTYKVEDFPAGPISNPDRTSLQAVLKPEKTSYYYFVSQNDGTHAFNREYEDHLEDVRYYRSTR